MDENTVKLPKMETIDPVAVVKNTAENVDEYFDKEIEKKKIEEDMAKKIWPRSQLSAWEITD